MKKIPTALSLWAALSFAFFVLPGAQAATVTNQFKVTITVQPSCIFVTTPITDMNFGAVAADATNVTAATSFKMQCTIGTAPQISLTSANSWTMVGVDSGAPYDNTAAFIPYGLFSDSARSVSWAGTTGAPAVLNDGSEQNLDVYGKVADVGKTVGAFSDTVTITLTF